jgi:ubiquinone/menaquinone biosynthesis C-methylase UbiE
MMDYLKEYADFWTRADRLGAQSLADLRLIAAQIVRSCGIGSVLDVGSGMGWVVQRLLREGIDARGVDIAPRVIEACNARMPGRFTPGSILELPFGDNSFDTIVSTDCLEHIAAEDVAKALAELHRVCGRSLFLRITTGIDRDGRWRLSVHNRDWWERQLLGSGFRKHPRYYAVLPYEELEHDPGQITIVMEKLPAESAPIETDMLRKTGRWSDAEVARYQLAAGLVRPGDHVLDVASGAGYGAYVIRQNSLAARVTGIDPSESARTYAAANFEKSDSGLEFRRGDLPAALAEIPDESFDLVVSLQKLEQPKAMLAEFRRILRPGGRVIVAVSNPNWAQSSRELFEGFIADGAWQQTVEPRRLRRFDPVLNEQCDSDWCIAVAMKSPRDPAKKDSYRETVFANAATAKSPVGRYAESYENPWLVHSMVHIGYRLRSGAQLGALAWRVIDELPPASADAGAALCIVAYRAVERIDLRFHEAQEIGGRIEEYLKVSPANPHILRWQISLTFVMGRIWLEVGEIERAIEWFLRCAAMDSLLFSPHLATKTAEAFYEAGRLNLRQKRNLEAERIWTEGLQFGRRLLAVPLDAVLVNSVYPNLFDHGDGMREFTLALDFLTRCANGLHLLQRQREGFNVDWQSLDRSFRWLSATLQENLSTAQSTVGKLMGELEETRGQLISRTMEVDAARTELASRTAELDRDREELRKRNLEVDAERKELIARTNEVTAARKDLADRTAELSATRQDLIDRTSELDAARQDLIDRTAELDAARKDSIDRTAEVDAARKDLIDRTFEVDAARKDLIDRTVELDEARAQLKAKKRFRKG